jgi:hypothetical protein
MGQGVEPQLPARAVPSEKWRDSMAVYGAGMPVIAAFFGPYAPDALTPPASVFSHNFKRFKRSTKLATSSDIKGVWPSPRPGQSELLARSVSLL